MLRKFVKVLTVHKKPSLEEGLAKFQWNIIIKTKSQYDIIIFPEIVGKITNIVFFDEEIQEILGRFNIISPIKPDCIEGVYFFAYSLGNKKESNFYDILDTEFEVARFST